jgi:hypothetical protein
MINALVALVFSILLLFPLRAGAAPVATPPYSVSVFAPSFAGQKGADSIAFDRDRIFVGYSGGTAKDGSDHKFSTIVEYDLQGKPMRTFSVMGHNDGLRVRSVGFEDEERGSENTLWALQNEDGNPNLAIIELRNGRQTNFTFPSTPHGGGYDDIVFAGKSIFITASNPSKSVNTDPAVVSAKVGEKEITLEQVLAGNASAINVVTGITGALNLQDPDSMTLDPRGDLVFTSQADMELVVIQHPGKSCQNVFVAPLTTTQPTVDTPMADDTAFARSGQGRIIFADKGTNIVYSMTTPYFAPGAAYSAYQDSAAANGFVGQLDLSTGLLTPIISGLGNPGGMAFISTDSELNDPKIVNAKIDNCP